MRTKIALLSASVLVSAGFTMHHFRYCPLQHLKSALSHHQSSPTARTDKAAKDAKDLKDANAAASTATLALNP